MIGRSLNRYEMKLNRHTEDSLMNLQELQTVLTSHPYPEKSKVGLHSKPRTISGLAPPIVERRTEFLNLSTVHILGGIILCCVGGKAVPCIIGCLSALWTLQTRCHYIYPPTCDRQKCLQTLPVAPYGQNNPCLRFEKY